MSDYVIEMNSVHKSVEDTEALPGVDLNAPSGTVYGLLGRNGSGKTTAIKLLTGVLRADRGKARVFDG